MAYNGTESDGHEKQDIGFHCDDTTRKCFHFSTKTTLTCDEPMIVEGMDVGETYTTEKTDQIVLQTAGSVFIEPREELFYPLDKDSDLYRIFHLPCVNYVITGRKQHGTHRLVKILRNRFPKTYWLLDLSSNMLPGVVSLYSPEEVMHTWFLGFMNPNKNLPFVCKTIVRVLNKIKNLSPCIILWPPEICLSKYWNMLRLSYKLLCVGCDRYGWFEPKRLPFPNICYYSSTLPTHHKWVSFFTTCPVTKTLWKGPVQHIGLPYPCPEAALPLGKKSLFSRTKLYIVDVLLLPRDCSYLGTFRNGNVDKFVLITSRRHHVEVLSRKQDGAVTDPLVIGDLVIMRKKVHKKS